MSDCLRFGLPLAFLIAAGALCLFLAFAPTAHTPQADRMTGEIAVNVVQPVPHIPDPEKVTTNA